MAYRASISIEVAINTNSEADANRIALHIAKGCLPTGCSIMEPPEIELRIIRSVDKQIVTHMPNLARERIVTMLQDMPLDKQLILALCVTPHYSHVVFTAVRQAVPNATTEIISKHITELKMAGWLEVVNA